MAEPRIASRLLSSAEALAWWRSAPLATPFMHPGVLATMVRRVEWCAYSVDEQDCCLWPRLQRLDGAHEAPEFSYFVGPLWSAATLALSPRSRLLQQAAVMRAACAQALAEVGGFSFETAPGDHDLRGVLAWAREVGLEAALRVRPQYTARLQLAPAASEDTLAAGMARSRRRARHRWLAGERLQARPARLDEVLDLYRQLAQRQGRAELYARREAELVALTEVVQAGHGLALAWSDGADRAQVLRLALLTEGQSADVLALATDGARQAQALPAVMPEFLAALAARGSRCHDFNGANSLSRASDVHSYGAEVALYFAVDCWPGAQA